MEFESILSYGAVGDGKTDNTAAFKSALSGGRSIKVPSGTFLTGPIDIKSGTRLDLDKDAVILFIPDQSIYEPVFTRWEGVNCYAMHPCVFINEAEDIVILPAIHWNILYFYKGTHNHLPSIIRLTL